MVTPSSTVEVSTTLRRTVQSRPIAESTIVVSGPMTLPSPIMVAPERITPGSRTTSVAIWTPQST
jgi:hypothetical protein